MFGSSTCPATLADLQDLGVKNVDKFLARATVSGGGVAQLPGKKREVTFVDCAHPNNASACADIPAFPLVFHCDKGVCYHVTNPHLYMGGAEPNTDDYTIGE